MRTGALYAWGNNEYGQVGMGTSGTGWSKTTLTPISDKTWKQAAAGLHHTKAIDTDGTLYMWGSNKYGQLGNGKSGEGEKETTPTPIGDKTWKQAAAGTFHTVAIDTDGTLYAWGSNNHGQLGNGKSGEGVHETTPTKIGDKTWKQVFVGSYHTMAIDTDGTLYAWGSNQYGQLGNGKSGEGMRETTPTKIGNKTWKQASSGDKHTVAIDTDGAIYAWGWNRKGQLGTGGTTNTNVPTPITKPDKAWTQVSVGSYHTMAIDTDDTLYAWGWNKKHGQLGTAGITINKCEPTPISLP